VKRLFSGVGPVIDFGARLIGAFDRNLSATPDGFFERTLLDRGFLAEAVRYIWRSLLDTESFFE